MGNVGKDTVNHAHEHSIFERVAGVFNYGDDIRPRFGYVEEVTARAVGEFNGVDISLGADDVGDVGDGSSGGGSKVEDFGARFDPDVVYTSQNGSSDWGCIFVSRFGENKSCINII